MGSDQHACGGAAELEDRLSAQALADGDPAGWFERFYRAAAAAEVELAWQRAEPHWLFTRWAAEPRIDGSARRAIVVGCGLGTDAEYVARLGFHVVAFDIVETAIMLAKQPYPDSSVQYQAANLLNPPAEACSPQGESRFAIWAANGGSPTHPNWYYNLKAHPRITAEVGTQTFTVLTEELGGTARAELWPKLVAEWPKPVAGSPDLGAAQSQDHAAVPGVPADPPGPTRDETPRACP